MKTKALEEEQKVRDSLVLCPTVYWVQEGSPRVLMKTMTPRDKVNTQALQMLLGCGASSEPVTEFLPLGILRNSHNSTRFSLKNRAAEWEIVQWLTVTAWWPEFRSSDSSKRARYGGLSICNLNLCLNWQKETSWEEHSCVLISSKNREVPSVYSYLSSSTLSTHPAP